MTSGAPWSVKGIDPKAREVAKDLARRSGMTLGEWLNRMILEDEGPEDVASQAFFGERGEDTAYEAPRTPEPIRSAAPAAPRYEAPQHPGDEIGRVAMALDRLTDRIEQSEERTGAAIGGVEHAVREAVERVEAAERQQVAVAARFEGVLEERRMEQVRIAERVRRVEQEAAGPRSAEALRALEQALGKVANHLYEGEGRTREMLEAVEARIARVEAAREGGDPGALIEDVVSRVGERLADAEARTAEALESLRNSFAVLDGRLHSVETTTPPAVEKRLEDLAAVLNSRVEAARSDIAQKLQAAADGRFDRMERKLGEMADHVRKAEQSSAQAIEKMGREVLTMADTLNRRVQTVEHRNADAIEQVGGEVARIAQAVEQKLGRNDGAHAEALERLGAEIGRITERLAERIGNAERRSAQAIDDVGEQVTRVSDRLNQRHERASEDLLERIRQSEERTARLLEEAREKIDRSLAEQQRRLAEQIAPPPPPATPKAEPSPFATADYESFPAVEEPLARQAFAPAEPDLAPEPPPAQAFAASFPAEPEAPAFDADDFAAADGFDAAEELPEAAELEAVQPEAETQPQQAAAPEASEVQEEEQQPSPLAALEPSREPEDVDATVIAAAAPRPLSTREVIEQARAAARAAAQSGDAKGKKPPKEKPLKADKPGKIEKLPRESAGSLFSSFAPRSKRRAGSTLQTALLVTGGAAALGMAAGGIVLMSAEPSGAPPKRVADSRAIMGGGEIKGGEVDTTPLGAAPRAAVALAPTPLTQTAPAAAAAPSSQETSAASAAAFRQAVQAVESRQPGGLESLRKVANLGHAPAQFYLAKLYENGTGGVKRDMAQARIWTERAAQGGDRRAMHNLGLYYFEGAGGQKNSAVAAEWFRRAADLGLTDSQYNLGRLYEGGVGVAQNSAEAYKWYLIASRAGDEESRASAQRVRQTLANEARVVAERSAVAFRPASADSAPIGLAQAPNGDVATAQRALSRLGYYQGPVNGAGSPAFGPAVRAYQNDQGLPATGVLDQATLSRLSVFTR